ncbi:MAG: ATP-binding protein [Actinomycetota bacterium]
MRIRSKLVSIIAIPLTALTLVAAFGFSNQSQEIETAERAEADVVRNLSVQQAMLAVGNERLLAVAGEPDALDAAEESTDGSMSALADQMAGDPSATISVQTVTDQITQARSTDTDGRSGLYGSALIELQALEIDRADDYPTATARNAAVANHTAVDALELREWAWIAYFQLSNQRNLNQDSVASVVADFAIAEGTLRTAVGVAEAGGFDEFSSVLQTNGAVQLTELQVRALDDLNEGEVTVTAEEALTLLLDYRARWTETIIEQGTALSADVSDQLKSANDIRSLFALLAILGSVVLAGLIFVMYRSITSPLEALLIRASEVADVELPLLMNALREAETTEALPVATPIPIESADEIGELVEAFNNVQSTAYDLATEQALSRRNVADMFVNLGRRNQQLLQRILSQLTQLQQHEEDPDKLRELFELDNIITRMRRNAESLLALAGAQTSRQWSQPIEMENTVRAAFGEVEGYERIEVAHLAEAMVTGRVVSDVTHLLAELLENALNFSDSQTMVVVNGHVTRDGYMITITDQGIGMSLSELEDNNSRITDPPPLDQVPTRFLGLYVVGRLAERHGIEVRLTEAELTGTIARVLLPPAILSVETLESVVDSGPIDVEAALDEVVVDEDEVAAEDEVVEDVVVAEDVAAAEVIVDDAEIAIDDVDEADADDVVVAEDTDSGEDTASGEDIDEVVVEVSAESEETADATAADDGDQASSDEDDHQGDNEVEESQVAAHAAVDEDGPDAEDADTSADEADEDTDAATAEQASETEDTVDDSGTAGAEDTDTSEDAATVEPVEEPAAAEASPKPASRRRSRKKKKAAEERSPLDEVHDLEAELAALTAEAEAAEAAAEAAEAEAAESDDAPTKGLPRRNRRSSDKSNADPAAAADNNTDSNNTDSDDADGKDTDKKDDAAAGGEADNPSDWVGLPVRKRGDALESATTPDVPKVAAERRAATESSEHAASNFSSMLSAFSSGISQGLEAAEDEDSTKGKDR